MLPPMEVEEIVFGDTKRGDNECDNLAFTHTPSITSEFAERKDPMDGFQADFPNNLPQ